MIDRSVYSAANCSLGRTLSIVGEKWTMLILREAFNGADRFEQFQQILGCARNLLATRLDTLVEEGVFERVAYKNVGDRTRHRYVLTRKGADLMPGLVALTQWGDHYLADPQGPSSTLVHKECGGNIQLQVQCECGHIDVMPDEVDMRPGPGALRISDHSSTAKGA